MIKHITKILWNKRKNNALIVLEIFLSFLVLFFVLTFVAQSYFRYAKPLGFETTDRYMIHLNRLQDSSLQVERNTNLQIALSSLEKVEKVGFGNFAHPFTTSAWMSTNDDLGFEVVVKFVEADENMKDALGMKLIEGRWFNDGDMEYKDKPIVITKNFIDNYFPGENLMDSILTISNPPGKVIGIVEAYKYEGEFADDISKFFYYKPKTDLSMNTIYLDMVAGTPISYEEEIAKTIESVTKDRNALIQNIEKVRKTTSKSNWVTLISLLSICAFLCINIALGLFGVLYYTISKRKSEIGLRMALGAAKTDVTIQFIMEMLIITLIGIVLALIFAIQFPILNVFDIEDKYYYNAIIASTIIILFLVLLCAIFPSLQASKLKPAIALHEE